MERSTWPGAREGGACPEGSGVSRNTRVLAPDTPHPHFGVQPSPLPPVRDDRKLPDTRSGPCWELSTSIRNHGAAWTDPGCSDGHGDTLEMEKPWLMAAPVGWTPRDTRAPDTWTGFRGEEEAKDVCSPALPDRGAWPEEGPGTVATRAAPESSDHWLKLVVQLYSPLHSGIPGSPAAPPCPTTGHTGSHPFLATHLACAFPSRWKGSQLGRTPSGWPLPQDPCGEVLEPWN